MSRIHRNETPMYGSPGKQSGCQNTNGKARVQGAQRPCRHPIWRQGRGVSPKNFFSFFCPPPAVAGQTLQQAWVSGPNPWTKENLVWYFSNNNKHIVCTSLEIFCVHAGPGLRLKRWDYHEETGAKHLDSDERRSHYWSGSAWIGIPG